MKKKIKVVWICHFSNSEIRNLLPTKMSLIERLKRRIKHQTSLANAADFAEWNNNALQEMEFIDDVELHVIAPYNHLLTSKHKLCLRNIAYHFFREETSTSIGFLKRNLLRIKHPSFKSNIRAIKQLVNDINPDVIHLMGAENPNYSLSILTLPNKYPIIVQLQTLVNEPKFKIEYYTDEKEWRYYANVEKRVILRADYIGTKVEKFQQFILENIKPNAKFVDTTLAVIEKINKNQVQKEYDFVYFAGNINKAVDLAIEAFALAKAKNNTITLDVIGGYSEEYKEKIDARLTELGIEDSVTFEGLLPSHQDVINQIQKAKFALLPLKVDLVTGTIREALANGLPVVTTDTGDKGTQLLNSQRRTVLISTIGNHKALAVNMNLLLHDEKLATDLRVNGYIQVEQQASNKQVIQKWLKVYKECLFN